MRPEADIDFTPGAAVNAILFDTDAAGYESFTAQVFGTWAGTVTFEQSNDRVTWSAVQGINPTASGTATPLMTSTTGNGIFVFPVVARWVRARISAYTSGTVNGRAYMRNAVLIPLQAQHIIGSATQPTELRASATATGATTTRVNAAATTNATLVKNTAGNIFDLVLFNTGTVIRFLKLHNQTTAPTVGTSAVFVTIPLAPGVITRVAPVVPIRMSSGIAYSITGLQADTDATAVAAGEVTGFINWA